MPHDGKTAALCRTVGCEGGEDDVATGAEGGGNLLDVGGALGGVSEEVKDGAVVPDAVAVLRELGCEEVDGEPVDLCCTGAEACASVVERLLGDVENGEVGVAGSEEVVDERGLAGADVEDGRREIGGDAADERKGYLEVRAVPTAVACGPRGVDVLPVLL